LLKKGSANAETQTDAIEFLEPITSQIELHENSSRLVPQLLKYPSESLIKGDHMISQPDYQPATIIKPTLFTFPMDEHRLYELNQNLSEIFLKTKKSQNKPKSIRIDEDRAKYVWKNPSFLVLFLENIINAVSSLNNNPSTHKSSKSLLQVEDKTIKVNYRVEEWKKFKLKLFEIYEHRIENAAEISGAINGSYLGLDEHLILYFMEKHRDKQR
jgi:hypothetical protein